ncbi:MAG: hypothetical protein P1V21_27715 [Rhizobiaceae bacterium]|nr:hypothetical protein [Rhizobiaceae bacterium]
MIEQRRAHIDDLYVTLGKLGGTIGGSRRLGETNGRMEWPKRGIYFFFEDGEHRAFETGLLRVVRVGTHALKSGSRTTLWSRLSQHRGNAHNKGGNHRGSIFRDIVGTALAERDGGFCDTWGRGSSASSDIRANEKPMEQRVSEHIGRISLLWLSIPDETGPNSQRGYIERNAIALLSNYEKPAIDPPSKTWLGTHCNRKRVRQSGLWNSNHVNETYDPNFLSVFENLVGNLAKQ